MKAVILLAVLAVCQAQILIGTGASSQYNSQDGLGNYAFGYNEGHLTGATFRREAGTNGAVAGSYGLSDADGRRRVVNYVADATGFHADIKSNEPGVEPKDSADAAVNKPVAVIAAPAVHYASESALHHVAAPGVHYAAAPAAVRVAGPYGYYAW